MTNIATIAIVGGMTGAGCLLGQAVSGSTPIEIGDAVKLGIGAVTLALWANNKLNRIERRHASRLERVSDALLNMAASLDNLPCHRIKGECDLGTTTKMLNKVKQILEEKEETTTT